MFRLLFCLHLLRLLNMSLLQLLCLLLVALLHLLLSGIAGTLRRRALMFLLLLLLELLPLFVLVRDQLILLLLVFLIHLRVPGIGSRRSFVRRKIVWMDRGMSVVSRSFTAAGRRRITPSCLFRWYYSPAAKCTRPRSGGDRRLSMVCRGPQLRIAPGSLHMLSLSSDRRDVSISSSRFFFGCRTSGYAPFAAVESDVGSVVHNHRPVDVHVPDADRVHMKHSAVVEE